jgi:hypothetical protein
VILHTDMHMTVSEFLAVLATMRAAGYRPYFAPEPYGPAIRLKSPAGVEYCPITAVCAHRTGQDFPPVAVYSTVESLGLSPDDAYALSAAADLQGAEPCLRRQMLAALALHEASSRPDAR